MSETASLPTRPVPASYGAMLRFLFAGSGIWAMLIVVLTAMTCKTVWGSWGWLCRCPCLCNDCHHIFTKRFVYRSEESVIDGAKIPYHEYDVREFHIVGDIFNLHRPWVKALMKRSRKTSGRDVCLARVF